MAVVVLFLAIFDTQNGMEAERTQSAVASNCPRDVTCVIKMTSNVNPPACNPETLNTTAVSVHT